MKKITISGQIGYDVTPVDVSAQLDAAAGEDVDVHIASPGGFVYEGIEIFNALRDYKRKYPASQMMATIKGLAASMASYLAVNPAFDLVAAEDNAVFMVHNVWGYAVGDYREMQKTAEVFQGLGTILNQAYEKRTGKSKKEITELMDAESWFFGEEIKAAGFVDEIIKTDDDAEKSASMSTARASFQMMAQKLKEQPQELEKIAAMVYPKNIIDALERKKNAQTPAVISAGKNTQEGKQMTLAELLSQNPAAKIEHENALNEKYEAGKLEGKNSMKASMTAAGKYLGPESAYPSAIKSLAVEVLNGNKTVDTLESVVIAFDAMRETGNSTAAKAESDAAGQTPGQQLPAASADGVISTEADILAMVAKMKGGR
jgi:ATP-dependent protease ClpP protease subunit